MQLISELFINLSSSVSDTVIIVYIVLVGLGFLIHRLGIWLKGQMAKKPLLKPGQVPEIGNYTLGFEELHLQEKNSNRPLFLKVSALLMAVLIMAVPLYETIPQLAPTEVQILWGCLL